MRSRIAFNGERQKKAVPSHRTPKRFARNSDFWPRSCLFASVPWFKTETCGKKFDIPLRFHLKGGFGSNQ
jgi:hypothetical protein